jgi:hypothetical protein
VHAAVDLDAAADGGIAERGGRRLGVPLREAQQPRLADHAFGEQPPGFAIGPGMPAPEADVEAEVEAIRLGTETRVGVGIERQRLLAEYVLAGGEGRPHELLVERRRSGDQDAVDIVAGECGLQLGLHRHAGCPAERGGRGRRVADHAQLHAARVRQGVQVHRAHAPRAHEGEACHQPIRWPLRPSACLARAASTDARSLTSGTPTCQKAPPSVQASGAVRMAIT